MNAKVAPAALSPPIDPWLVWLFKEMNWSVQANTKVRYW
jgi:hypothetical protein